jgi:nucleotide-binding universal stress UspA family protein
MDESDRALPEGDTDEVEPAPPTSLVVGHDRSAGSEAALELALQLGSELHAPVVILRAWSMVTAPRPANWTFGYVPSEDELAEAVQQELVADTRARVDRFPGVDVGFRVDHRGPARALIGASREARMLVVGSRGLGGFGELVLGSVSDQCVRYAACPVLVARQRS